MLEVFVDNNFSISEGGAFRSPPSRSLQMDGQLIREAIYFWKYFEHCSLHFKYICTIKYVKDEMSYFQFCQTDPFWVFLVILIIWNKNFLFEAWNEQVGMSENQSVQNILNAYLTSRKPPALSLSGYRFSNGTFLSGHSLYISAIRNSTRPRKATRTENEPDFTSILYACEIRCDFQVLFRLPANVHVN